MERVIGAEKEDIVNIKRQMIRFALLWVAVLALSSLAFVRNAFAVTYATPGLRADIGTDFGYYIRFEGEGIGKNFNMYIGPVGSTVSYGEVHPHGPLGAGTRYLPFFKYDAGVTIAPHASFDRNLGFGPFHEPWFEGGGDLRLKYLFKEDADSITPGNQSGYLYGYKITKWTKDNQTTPQARFDGTIVPYRVTVYRATLEKDTSIIPNYPFRITNALSSANALPSGIHNDFVFAEAFPASIPGAERNLLTPQAIKRSYIEADGTVKYADTILHSDLAANALSPAPIQIAATEKSYRMEPVDTAVAHTNTEIPGFDYYRATLVNYNHYEDIPGKYNAFANPIVHKSIYHVGPDEAWLYANRRVSYFPDIARVKRYLGSDDYTKGIGLHQLLTGNTAMELKLYYRMNPNYLRSLTVKNYIYRDLNRDGIGDRNVSGTPVNYTAYPTSGAEVLRSSTSTDVYVKFGSEQSANPSASFGYIDPKVGIARYIPDRRSPYGIELNTADARLVGNPFVRAQNGSFTFAADMQGNYKTMDLTNAASVSYTDYLGMHVTDLAVKNALDAVTLRDSSAPANLLSSPYFATSVDLSSGTPVFGRDLSFRMPNQNVRINYHWVRNPNYIPALRVYYRYNQLNLTSKVVDELRARGVTIASLGDSSYAAALIREFDDSHPADGRADGIEYVIAFDADGNLDAAVHGTPRTLKVYAPNLENYLPHASMDPSTNANPPDMGYTLLGATWGDAATPGAGGETDESYTINLSEDIGISFYDVNYTPDVHRQFEYVYSAGVGGKILGPIGLDYVRSAHNPFLTEYRQSTNPHVPFKMLRVNPGAANETFTINLERDASGKILSFYDAVADTGYQLKKWTWDIHPQAGQVPIWTDVPADPSITQVSGVHSVDLMNLHHAIIPVRPVFEKIESMWGNYRFIVDTQKLARIGTELHENILLEDDASHPGNDKTWGDLLSELHVGASVLDPSASGSIKWIDLQNNREMNPSEILIGTEEIRTFKAVWEPNASTSLYTPAVQGQMDAGGITALVLEQSIHPVTSAFRYIVTDDTGEILANITGTQLLTTGGVISSDLISQGLVPGYNYRVYTVPAASSLTAASGTLPTGLAVGSDISMPSTDTTIPTEEISVYPALDPHPAHPNRLQIIVRPTTANTKYQLLDPNGSPVGAPQIPGSVGMPVVFDNIVQGGIYTIVPMHASSVSALGGHGTPITIDTDNAVLAAPHKLILRTATAPVMVEINHVQRMIPSNGIFIFEDVMRDTPITVEFESQGLVEPYYPLSGVDFSRTVEHHVVSGGNSIHSFMMPNEDLILTANYMPSDALVASGSNAVRMDTYDGAADADAAVFPGLVGEPLYKNTAADPVIYRLHVKKTQADADEVRKVQDIDRDRIFVGIFGFKVEVEYKKHSESIWQTYDGPVHPTTLTLATNIIAADMSREYHLYQVDTSAVERTDISDEDFHKPSYTNAFTVNDIEHQANYLFGYWDAKKHPVHIRSTRTQAELFGIANRNTTFGQWIAGYAELQTMIRAESALPAIDANGITWTYQGMSTDQNSFVPVSLTDSILSETQLYMYFAQDQEQRQAASDQLFAYLQEGQTLLGDRRVGAADRELLVLQMQSAEEVLNRQSPRKASTQELNHAAQEIRALLDRIRAGFPSGGSSGGYSGGSSSGSSGGSSGGLATRGTVYTENQKIKIHVGADGNWELLDAGVHRWVFRKTSGEMLSGWHQLSYIYQNEQRTDWYHFGQDGMMSFGWLFEPSTGKWYYLSEQHNGYFGHMLKGWYFDSSDLRWYYFDQESGAMYTGWHNIQGKWYYFHEKPSESTWVQNPTTGKWEYRYNTAIRPMGSLYMQELTPDGYRTDGNGAWIE